MLRLFLFLIQNNAGLIQICSRSDPLYDFSTTHTSAVDLDTIKTEYLNACY